MIWPGQTRAASASLPTTAPRASINAISTSKARAPRLIACAIREQFAAVRQQQKTPKCNARWAFGSWFHGGDYSEVGKRVGNFKIFQELRCAPAATCCFSRLFRSAPKDDWPSLVAAENADGGSGTEVRIVQPHAEARGRQRKKPRRSGSWTTKTGTTELEDFVRANQQ